MNTQVLRPSTDPADLFRYLLAIPDFAAMAHQLALAEYQRQMSSPPVNHTEEQWDNWAIHCRHLFLIVWYMEAAMNAAQPKHADDSMNRAAQTLNIKVTENHRVPFHTTDITNQCPHCGNGIWRGEHWCDDCGAVLDEKTGKWGSPAVTLAVNHDYDDDPAPDEGDCIYIDEADELDRADRERHALEMLEHDANSGSPLDCEENPL